MVETWRRLARRLWPRTLLPGPRFALAREFGRLRNAANARAFRRWSAWARRQHGPDMELVLADGRRLYVLTDDRRAWHLWRHRETQRTKTALWSAIASMRPSMVVDVGANYGEFALASIQTRVHHLVLEPNPRVVECLRKSFATMPNAEVLGAAAGAINGTAIFFIGSDSGSGSLSDCSTMHKATEITVPVLRIDSLLADRNWNPAGGLALKIDVEGHEGEVLDGAAQSLSKAAWWRALVEFSPALLGERQGATEALWDRLRQHPGVVIPALGEGEPFALDDLPQLPVAPPGDECDILIGRGRPVSH